MDIHNDAVFVQILSFYLYPMIEFSFWYLCIFSDTHFYQLWCSLVMCSRTKIYSYLIVFWCLNTLVRLLILQISIVTMQMVWLTCLQESGVFKPLGLLDLHLSSWGRRNTNTTGILQPEFGSVSPRSQGSIRETLSIHCQAQKATSSSTICILYPVSCILYPGVGGMALWPPPLEPSSLF